MELIIFIIVVGVIFSNLNKQRKASSNRDEPREAAAPGTARPRTPTVRPMETRPQTPSPFAPRQQHSMPQSAPTAQVKPVKADAKAKPFAPSVQKAAKSDDAPRDVDSPAQGTSPAAAEPAGALRDMGIECDDGYGSLKHTSHEGEELHAPGVHSDATVDKRYAGRPGELAAHASEASDDGGLFGMEELSDEGLLFADGDDVMPELMGKRLDAEEMRRAVIMSEIMNKRGGRRGWARM